MPLPQDKRGYSLASEFFFWIYVEEKVIRVHQSIISIELGLEQNFL
ncbi:hypothetical protein DOT_0639 [Desulfosporosinus sp. OT]|nr:hypothetical protein DOT_0639 [Desulfosporosinus sp. OT]